MDGSKDYGDETEGQKQQPSKRGQKGKQKKIREKYKDQDDEEKALRMQLLHQAQKEDGKRAKKKRKEQQMKVEKENKLARAKVIHYSGGRLWGANYTKIGGGYW